MFRTLRSPARYLSATLLGLLSSALAASACDHDQPRAKPAEVDAVEVDGGRLALGFSGGTLRRDVEVRSFRISRHPITRGEFAACVDADACKEVECAADIESGSAAAQMPVDCVSREDAKRFCEWTSGRLPTLPEWLKAARGAQPQRFAWGETPPTCEQHPLAGASLAALSGVNEAMFGNGAPRCVFSAEDLVVGKHPSGASATGLQDVLLTKGELVEGVAESPYGACTGSNDSACFVYGLEAGALDAVAEGGAGAVQGVGFRCVWER